MTNADMNKSDKEKMEARISEQRSKLSNSEKKMLAFMDEQEAHQYLETKVRMKDYEAKLKKKRDAAVRRQKAEYAFWKQVRERKDEVLEFLAEQDAATEAEDAEKESSVNEEAEVIETASNQYTNGYSADSRY